ncbi:unnamed protein product [Trichogramma brassicae]|uniref:Uncharacterized protein n=1 Tax=Trichogramma brassicae TaxID=86971 RepID=A0A6H5II34_9HYME|nr:unnamed protein product [Trichogramma brassicae]
MRQGMRVNAQDNKGNTALHLLLECGSEIEKTIELLLRRGADPTLANAEGEVPLLKIFWRGEASLMKILLKAIDGHCRRRRRQTYPVNFQDRRGHTALHYVLERHKNNAWFAWLLSKGADPNLVNDQGISPVDLVCSSWRYGADDKMFRSLVKHCNDTRQALHVNARDKSGRILLNWALENRDKMKVEWLLRTGVDPNLADEQGSTALHVISQQRNDYGFAELLFKICDENNRTVQVDAKDKSDRTPIEYAVANFYPNIVAALLDRGASLVWPTRSHFDELYRQRDPPFEYKFTRLIGALAVMECLENRNYEFERSKALRIMKYFDEFKMFADLENDLYDVGTFPSSSAKSMMIKPSLSLHDLIQLSPEEAWTRLTYQDCYDYWSSINVCAFSLRSRVISARVICEKMSRRFFFRPWAVISYLELIRYRLPEECCEMIIDPLTNQDLLDICLAARDNNVDSEEQRIQVSVPET